MFLGCQIIECDFLSLKIIFSQLIEEQILIKRYAYSVAFSSADLKNIFPYTILTMHVLKTRMHYHDEERICK